MKKTILLSSLFCFPVYADIIATGEYRFGPDTPENFACIVAVDRAKQKAISEVLGEKVDVVVEENCLNENCNHHQQTFNSYEGQVKSFQLINKTVSEQIGYRSCQVKIKANVEKIENNIQFNVYGNFNYRNQQHISFNLVSNQTGNVVLFNYYNDTFKRIYEKDIAFTETEHVIPSNDKVMIANLEEDQHQSKEILLFLFHSDQRNFKDEYTKTEMETLLVSIPSNKRKVVKRYINIMR